MKDTDIVEIFNKYKNDSRMCTEVYATGCIERTEIICEELESKGIKVYWIGLYGATADGITLNEDIFQSHNRKGSICWQYHYAPVLFNDEKIPLVLDVCMMDGPERIENWLKHFQNVENNPLLCPFDDEKDKIIWHAGHFKKLAEIALEKKRKNKIYPNSVTSKWLEEFNKKQNAKGLIKSKEQIANKKTYKAPIAGKVTPEGIEKLRRLLNKGKSI